MNGHVRADAGAVNNGRRWEWGLLAAVAGLSALAWLTARRWPMPGMRAGVLAGSDMRVMGGAGGTAPMALGLFLLAWVVMMAAMMLQDRYVVRVLAEPAYAGPPPRQCGQAGFRVGFAVGDHRTGL